MQKCLVIGAGKSGKSAYNQLLKYGYMPVFYDDEFIELSSIEKLIDEFEFCVVSPGIPQNHKLIKLLNEKNIKIISEIEQGYLFNENKNQIIAVTGTNGKTTVVSLLQFLLGELSDKAGNIGVPYTSVINNGKPYTILELSSFQLQNVYTFKPAFIIFTNIAPDHIDYHGSYENYINAKFNIFNNVDNSTVVIYNGEDGLLKNKVVGLNCSKCYHFSIDDIGGLGAFISVDSHIIVRTENGEEKLFKLADAENHIRHNVMNILAVALCLFLLGKYNARTAKSISEFVYPPFRMKTSIVKGKTIINDSKATNLASTLSALDSIKTKVVLLVGGKGKNEQYDKLFQYKNIKSVVAYGESADKFSSEANKNNYKNITKVSGFSDAVKLAYRKTGVGETLLFSPACSSFDQFSSYYERGVCFDNIIQQLIKS